MSHDSLAPLTCCEHLRVWLDRNFWMRRRGSGFQLVMVQKPVTHEAPKKTLRVPRVARLLAPRPDAKRPSRMSPCRKCMIWCPRQRVCPVCPGISVARVIVRAQGQPAGTEVGSESSDESVPLPVPMDVDTTVCTYRPTRDLKRCNENSRKTRRLTMVLSLQ